MFREVKNFSGGGGGPALPGVANRAGDEMRPDWVDGPSQWGEGNGRLGSGGEEIPLMWGAPALAIWITHILVRFVPPSGSPRDYLDSWSDTSLMPQIVLNKQL